MERAYHHGLGYDPETTGVLCIYNYYTYLYLYNTNSVCLCVCVCVCLSSIGGQTAGPIMTKFGTHMRIDLGMVPTKNCPHEWPGSVGSLGPISESGLISCQLWSSVGISCQLLLRAVVWQMTSRLIRRRNDVVFAAFNQPVSVRPMNVQKINNNKFTHPTPGGSASRGGGGRGEHFKVTKLQDLKSISGMQLS